VPGPSIEAPGSPALAGLFALSACKKSVPGPFWVRPLACLERYLPGIILVDRLNSLPRMLKRSVFLRVSRLPGR
jgi:hypothetical protein